MKKNILLIVLVLVQVLMVSTCVKTSGFEIPKSICSEDMQSNISFEELDTIYDGEVFQIQQDLIMEGYIASSDRAGNFFGVIHIQNQRQNPSMGLELLMDLREVHLLYPAGSKVLVQLKGLFIGKRNDTFQIGGVFNAFGNLSVGRLPSSIVQEHLILSCDMITELTPATYAVADLNDNLLSTLVQIEGVEFKEELVGLPFAAPKEETERIMIDCNKNELALLNSGFSDFQSTPLPDGNGNVMGVLSKKGNQYLLAIKDEEDISFLNERCIEVPDEFSSERLFISELADPDNNSGARFVELYNEDMASLSLNGWSLRRYTNANTEVSSEVDLSDYVIEGKSTLVLSPNATEFENVYGFAPDIVVSTNSPADSNGDDNLELVDPFGVVIDVFGVPGEDGSGTNHEFEDGRAMRKLSITSSNASFTFGEWIICNDTGAEGTVKAPKKAPDDYTPGARN